MKANKEVYMHYLAEIPHSQHGVPKHTAEELAD